MPTNTINTVARQVAGQILYAVPGMDIHPPLFVAGCQRSGTTMLLHVLRGVQELRVFGEADHGTFSAGTRIRPGGILRYVMFKNRGKRVVLKPLNDAQYLDKLLGLHPDAQAIWIYRDYRDVASSMVERWGDAQIVHLREIASGRYSGPGSAALGERLNGNNRSLVERVVNEDITPHEAAALVWALRNSIYFDLSLEERPDVLLVRYEDLCTAPDAFFPPLLEFLDCAHTPEIWAKVHAKSVSGQSSVEIGERIGQICDDLMSRLDAAYARAAPATLAEAIAAR